ncbi:MAG: hypothetical protein AAGG50_14910, partial [Bacteroidota bacterium]
MESITLSTDAPVTRTAARQQPQRLRTNAAVRRLARETRLAPADFILPLFVKAGTGRRDEIASMPGVYQ